MREFLVGFVTAFAFRATPLECLGFGLFCALPHLLIRKKILHRISHDLALWIPLFIGSFFLKEVSFPTLTFSIPDFFPDTWWTPFVIRWKVVASGAIFHLLVDLVSGHGATVFTKRIPALTGGNPWATVPSLVYVVTTGGLVLVLDSLVPLVFAAGTVQIVLGYGIVFPPLFVATTWLWIKLSWRYRTLSPDGKIRIDIRELAKNWIESACSSPSESPLSEETTETAQEQISNEVSDEPGETPANETDQDFSNPWVVKIRKEFIKPYEDLWKETRLEEVIERVLRMLDAEGDAPSVAGDRYDGEIKSQYDLLTQISLSEHTYDVVRLAVKKLKSELPQGWQGIYPRLVLACLFHDLGKLPSVRGQSYVTGQHPVDGANLADLILKEADHPWREAVADLVRKHHERPGENTSIEHRILVWADKEARLEETTALAKKVQPKDHKKAEKPKTPPVPTVVTPQESTKKGKPETRPIPADFPLSPVFQKILENTNKVIKGRVWVAFSQSDGNVYVYPETLHKAISDTAREEGFEDPFFHSQEEKRNCLQSFYDEFRRKGWVPEKLVGKDYYGNFFRLWNPLKSGFTCTFYVPIRVSAFNVPLGQLEKIRKADPILSQVKIFGPAPPCERRGKCDGKCPFGR